jgi:DNA-binding NtrC family response regulator
MNDRRPVPRLLIVDDDRTFRLSVAELLRQDGYEIELAEDASEAAQALERETFDLVLLDLRMPGLSGVRFVEVLRTRGARTPVLMISGFGTVEAAVEALQVGADDFLTKPVDPDVLSARVASLLERRPVHGARRGVSSGLIGQSAPMRAVFEQIRRVAPSKTTVLITGETGTGKELVARALHAASDRAEGPFVAVNCASLAEGVLESELFGHLRGAFTGAVTNKAGLFEAASGGTLLLDEVGDMSLRLQQRLLRVLQEGEVMPVGSTATKPIDVRVLAATHRDLGAETRAERFREDLLYRLRVFPIALPALRERLDDLPLLVEAALERVASRSRPGIPLSCSPLAMRVLRMHSWPGNVRELFAAIESASIQADGSVIQAHDLPESVREAYAVGRQGEARHRGNGTDERQAILDALKECGGARTQAAEILGISRTTLWRRMRDLGISEAPEP